MARPKVNATLNLGIVAFEMEDFFSYFGRGTKAGPFLLVERKSGLCLETEMRADNFWQPALTPVHGGLNQQWVLERDNRSGEIVIRSVVNGKVLDRTQDKEDQSPVVLWDMHDGAWQRWVIQQTSDKLGWIIQSAYDERAIDVGQEPKIGQGVWVWEKHELLHQQFLILPTGKIPR
jgi:hypothetical protein